MRSQATLPSSWVALMRLGTCSHLLLELNNFPSLLYSSFFVVVVRDFLPPLFYHFFPLGEFALLLLGSENLKYSAFLLVYYQFIGYIFVFRDRK